MQEKAAKDLIAENQKLRVRIEELQETLDAIRRGEVDGLVVSTPKGERVYTLTGAETPYRLLIEEMKEGALMLSDDNAILYANKGFGNIVKHPLVELVGKNIERIIAPTHLPTFKEILHLSRARQEVVENEIALKAKDNSLVPVHVSVALLTKNDPKTTLLIATDLTQHMEEQIKKYTINLEQEIAQRKKAEETLKESERRFKSLAENAPDVIMRFDANLRVMYLNSQVEAATGIPANRFLGKTNEEMGMPPNLVKAWNKLFHKADASRQTQQVEFDFTSLNGKRTFDLRVVPEYDENGSLVSFLGISRDITEGKKVEQALKESELLYRTIFDNSQDGFQLIEVVHDRNAKPVDIKLLRVNSAYERIIGVKASEVTGKTATFISPNCEPYWFEIPDKVAKTGQTQHVELFNKDIGKWLDCYYFPYAKDVVGTLFRDVTERKKLENELQDKERLAAIGATAGMVGHDIRNPLQAMTSDVYLAKSDLDCMPDGEAKGGICESLDSIQKNIEYVNKIVQDLQDFARPLAPTAKETDVEKVFDDVLSAKNVPQRITVTRKVEARAKKLIADPDFLKRILANLVNNAIQAMPEGGKLDLQAFRDKKDLVITVADSGIGIPEDIRPKLFTPLFTTKSKGQGFGLAVVKRMTEALGGTVTFESEKDNGTKFILRFPTPKRAKL